METNSPVGGSPQEQGRGTLILILGILSLIVCAILGPFAWLMGKADLAKMDQGLMDAKDQGITKAGMICGMIATILIVVGVVIGIVMVLFGGLAAAVA